MSDASVSIRPTDLSPANRTVHRSRDRNRDKTWNRGWVWNRCWDTVAPIILTGAAVGVFWAGAAAADRSLGRGSTLTGWTLAASVAALTLLGVRRRLPGIGLGSMATWTTVHLWTGIFAMAIYAIHVPAIWANGSFEGLLSLAFLAVAASGMLGWFLSRRYPRRIRLEVGSDDTPDDLARRAADIVADHQDPLSDYYQNHLAAYFHHASSTTMGFGLGNPRRQRRLFELRSLYRYLDEPGQHRMEQIADLVRRRDSLDHVVVLRRRLRTWVAVHAAGTALLIVASVVHIVLVHQHAGR